jgi:EmrB/QacA subfamily drug resistance transporter
METYALTDTAQKRAVIFVASVSSFVTPFTAAATHVALPAIQVHFRMDALLLAWVATSYLLSTAVFVLPFGKIADIYGRKKVFIWGLAAFTVSSLLTAAAHSSYQLLFARVLQGVGTAMIFSTGMAIVTSVFPLAERGRAIGITVAAVYVGMSAGPFVGGFLTQYFSWRSVFGVVVPLGILTLYLSIKHLKGEWADAHGEKLDILGSVVYGGAITLTMYGLSTLPSAYSVWAILSGIALFCVFVWWEFKVSSPVFNVELFTSNRGFAFSSLAALVNYSATFAVAFMLSLYLQYIKGLDPRSAGLVLVTQAIVMASFSPFAGKLSDRIEPRKVASLGMALTAVGLFGMTFVESRTRVAFIVLDLLVLGFGFALFSSPNMNAIMSSVEKEFYGLAAGAVASMRLLGQMLSMGIATLMLSVYVGPVEITRAQYTPFLGSMTATFLVFGFLCVLGIFASLARGQLRPE